MKIKYLGPIPLPEKLEGGMWVNVHPYGQHDINEVKEYPDDFGEELLATSKSQRFEQIIENQPEEKLAEETGEATQEAVESPVEEEKEQIKPAPITMMDDPKTVVKDALDAMGVPEDKIDTASFEPEKKVVPRIPTLKPKKHSRKKR